MLSHRLSVLFCGLLSTVLVAAEPDLSTPQAAWETIRTARENGEHQVIFDSLTPAKQREVLGETLMESVYWAGRPTETGHPMYESLTALDETLKSHGIDAQKLVGEINEAYQNARETRILDRSEMQQLILDRFTGDSAEFYITSRKQFARIVEEYIKMHEEEHRQQGDSVTEREKPQPDRFVSVQEMGGDRAVVLFKSEISGYYSVGGQRIRWQDEAEIYKKVEGRWLLDTMRQPPKEIELTEIKKSQIPYRVEIDLGPGNAVYYLLEGAESGKNTIAFWDGSAGEKPFVDIPYKDVTLWDGSQTMAAVSYIHSGGVTSFSSSERTITVYFVDPYKFTLTFDPGKKTVLRITKATPDELLFGEKRREHFLKLLESPVAKDRFEAFRGILDLLDTIYVGDLAEIADKVRPLTKDPNPAVANDAVGVLCHLGDEQTLLEIMDDWKKLANVPWSSEIGLNKREKKKMEEREIDLMALGNRVAGWNLKQNLHRMLKSHKPQVVKEKAISFLQSEDENKNKFAIGYFVRDSAPEDETVKQAIIAARKSNSADIRIAVIGELRHYAEPQQAAMMLLETLQDEDEKVIRNSLMAMNWVNDFIDSSAITPFLKHKNGGIRAMACYALQNKRDAIAVNALLEATRDKESYVRSDAANTLGINKAREGIDRIAGMIQTDPDPDVRRQAVYALRRYDDEKVLPILKNALANEKNQRVRQALEESIQRGE